MIHFCFLLKEKFLHSSKYTPFFLPRELIEGPDTVVVEAIFLATNTGPMIGPTGTTLPATGKRVELPICDIWKVSNGRIVENRIYYDQITFLTQLGLLKAPMQ